MVQENYFDSRIILLSMIIIILLLSTPSATSKDDIQFDEMLSNETFPRIMIYTGKEVQEDYFFFSLNRLKQKDPNLNLSTFYKRDFIIGEKEEIKKNFSLEEERINNIVKKIKDKGNTEFNTQNLKKVSQLVKQEEVNTKEFLNNLQKDPSLNETYSYAKELGYTKLNKTTRLIYDDGKKTTVSSILSEESNSDGIFIINIENNPGNINPEIKSYLSKLRYENNILILTMFGEDWGVELDLTNSRMISEWGNHTCSYGACVGYCFEYWLSFSGLQGLCSDFCLGIGSCVEELITTGLPPYLLPSCYFCVGCMVGAGTSCLEWACSFWHCSYYPCQEDCNDMDNYGNWKYICSWNMRYKYRTFNNWDCSSDEPMQGFCQLSSFDTDYTYIETCPYGCSNGECEGPITCYSDIECGEDRWVGSRYCSGGDVWQDRKEYDCHNPGTSNSYCDYNIAAQLREDCGGSGCSDGECGTPPECNGPNEYWCNSQCWAFCSSGTVLCCPSSGNPTQCYDEANSVCMSDGTICSPIPEVCNNLDDDCDGVVDSFSENCGIGVCGGGTRTCTVGSWSECSTAGNSNNETCNNLDDDCDGSTDEYLTQECGTDVGACVKGIQTCSLGVWGECGGSYVGPANETCNGIDDNCNTIADEDNICGDYPNATLVIPPDNYISYTGNITFNCSAKDNSNLANITLYHDISGNMSANETKNLSGTSDSAIWIINDIPHGTNFMWNCLVYDNDSHWAWGSNTTYHVNVTIINQPPIVTLISPQNNKLFEGYVNDVTFNSSVQDLEGLSNCTLYTGIGGTWVANETKNISGTSSSVSFNINDIPNGVYLWNVKCYDNDSTSSWAPNNWTFTINYTGESYCQEISEENSVYTLINDLHSNGTCFNITADNVTIDGEGHTIFYAEAIDGKGIINQGYNKTTIKNLNLVLARSGLSGAKNSAAIYFIGGTYHNITSVNILIQGQTSSTGKDHGLYFDDVSYSTISDVLINTSDTYNSHGIYLYADTDNQRYNRIYNTSIYVYGTSSSGIYIYGINNGGIREVIIGDSNSYSKNWHSVYIQSGTFGTGDTTIYNSSFVSEGSSQYGLYLYDAEGTFMMDSNISSKNSYDVVNNDNDHILLNVSYSNESVSGGSLTRGWYLDVKINDSYGRNIYQANVSGGDVFESLDFSELTDPNGEIPTQGLAEYINNGTKTYYNNYWINVTKSGYAPSNATVNFTETQNTFLIITLQNSLPIISDVILNSSLGTNLTTENLTVYVTANDSDGDNIKNIYNWYRDNKSLTSLYLTFEGQSNFTFTKDYSNNNNDAQVIDAIWDPSGGYDGFGAYIFNGENERLIIKDSDSIDINNNFTILTRVYPKDTTYALTIKGNLNSEYDYRLYSWSGYLRFRWGNGSESGLTSCDYCTEETDKWLFLGIVYSCNTTGSSVDFYINGEYNNTKSSNTTCVQSGTSDLWIGSRENLAYTLNGTIDELRIYNYSLSANQIKAIYENKTDTILSDETVVGEIYKCEATPYDGKEDGESMNSTDLLIVG